MGEMIQTSIKALYFAISIERDDRFTCQKLQWKVDFGKYVLGLKIHCQNKDLHIRLA